MRAYKFRIYPDFKRQKAIDGSLALAKDYYNLLLEKSINSYKSGNASVSMSMLNRYAKEIEKDKKFKQIYSQTRCQIRYRVLRAYQNFFRRCKQKKSGAKIKVGFPRFRSADRYKSLTYPQNNGSFSIEKGRLRISRIGTMRIEQHRNVVGNVKTMTIKKESNEYYAIFTAEQIINPQKVKDTNPVGIDMGLNSFVALSDGQMIQKPKFFKRKAKRIARWQRVLERRTSRIDKKMRKEQSKRRQKAKEKLQNEWNNITNQSNDFMHKLSERLVHGRYTSFAVEDLNIQNMVKNRSLAQSIQNASWNRFIQMLSYKAESAGLRIEKADARNTSKECSNCGNVQDIPLSERTYNCQRCGMSKDRDVNASINILHRATTLGQRGSHAQGESVRPQQEATLEELRTDKTHPLQDAVIV